MNTESINISIFDNDHQSSGYIKKLFKQNGINTSIHKTFTSFRKEIEKQMPDVMVIDYESIRPFINEVPSEWSDTIDAQKTKVFIALNETDKNKTPNFNTVHEIYFITKPYNEKHFLDVIV